MIVCDRQFADPDPGYPQFSMLEVDIFSGKEYGLSIRKDLRHGRFQAFRHWFSEDNKRKHSNALAFQPQSFVGEGDGFYDVEVVFESPDLQAVLDYCTKELQEHRKGMGWTSEMLFNMEHDVACQHTGSWRERAIGCRDP